MAAKRKLGAMAEVIEEPIDPADELMFLCLGGGNEVGRSCHIIQYKGKTIMVRLWQSYCLRYSNCTDHVIKQLDAGQHPAREGLAALPYFDEFDLSTIDILLISQ